jgi:hypothetical protein
MKPYDYINCILQTIINDYYSDEVEYYVFEDNIRWNDLPTYLVGASLKPGRGGYAQNLIKQNY